MKSVALIVAFLAWAPRALAQTADGRISGIVTDPSGAIAPGVEIEVVGEETGVRFTGVSNDQGRYLVAALQPGRWRLAARLPGFRTYQRTGIVLGTSEHLAIDIRLEVGNVSETVTVTGAAPLLETDTSDISQLIESKNVTDLPLNGRRAISLAAVVPAAVWVNYSGNAKPNFSLAGGRTQSQVFWIDGGTARTCASGSARSTATRRSRSCGSSASWPTTTRPSSAGRPAGSSS